MALDDASLLNDCVAHDSFVKTCVSCNPIGAVLWAERRAARYKTALQDIERVLGPASCACAGLQCEVDEALDIVRSALNPESKE